MVRGTEVLTVAQLIELLQKVENKQVKVVSEGCDCDGDVGGVEVTATEVYLTRV